MSDEVVDLDILRPKAKYIKLGGKKIDVSFVPCGITFEIDAIVRKLFSMSKDEITKNNENTKIAYDLMIELCVIFCKIQYSEMDEVWFRSHIDTKQLSKVVTEIREALIKSYAGVEEYGSKKKETEETENST